MLEQKITITDGRMVIPSSLRKQLKMGEVEEATISLENGNILITTKQQALERLRKLVTPHLDSSKSLADEFLEEKKMEVRKEMDEVNA